ncbi:hypothetical protein PRIPAC_82359, partial [Pristionchus pacificus]|uniref:Uncharacterized protein n=1 Tax=Pristionchus pacificus TaxID=54126 RepID=A0A2A6C393_PRIPA
MVVRMALDSSFGIRFRQTFGFTEDELKRVDCYEMSILYVYIGCCFACFAIAIVVLVLLTFHIRSLLKDAVRISMSEKTRGFHRIMTTALATQSLYWERLHFIVERLKNFCSGDSSKLFWSLLVSKRSRVFIIIQQTQTTCRFTPIQSINDGGVVVSYFVFWWCFIRWKK